MSKKKLKAKKAKSQNIYTNLSQIEETDKRIHYKILGLT